MDDTEVEISTLYDVEESAYRLSDANDITIVDDNISYDQFFKSHLLPNQPCLFRNSLIKEWECSKLWRDGSKINWSYLQEAYGTNFIIHGSQLIGDEKLNNYLLTSFRCY